MTYELVDDNIDAWTKRHNLIIHQRGRGPYARCLSVEPIE